MPFGLSGSWSSTQAMRPCRAHRLFVAAAASSALVLSTAQASAADAVVNSALASDDQCASGDEACALNALQLRGARAEADEDVVAAAVHPHHHHHHHKDDDNEGFFKQVETDISTEWADKLSGMIKLLVENVTVMEWKMYYLEKDVMSANATLFDIEGRKVGVNGTVVNWTAHPSTWIPTFTAPAKAKAAAAEPADAEDAAAEPAASEPAAAEDAGAEDAASEDADAEPSLLESEHPHHHKKDTGAPRVTKVQNEMTSAQKRLNAVWKATVDFDRDVNWMNNFMGVHRRTVHGRPVLEQQAAERVASAEDVAWTEDKKKIIMTQIESAWNQSYKIWPTFDRLGAKLENLKSRVARYNDADEPDLLQEASSEQAEDEAVADAEGVALMAGSSEEDWSLFGTTEQCCKCKTGTMGWSASGKCSFCATGVATKKSVSAECVKAKKGFKGNQFCADACGKVLR